VLTVDQVAEKLNARLPDFVKSVETAHAGDPFIVVDPSRIVEASWILRDDPDLAFEWMMCLSGVDYPPDSIAVVYHLHSQTHGHKLVMKVMLDRKDPHVASVETIWRMADWHERECYDMFGVVFDNHPDLRRILLPFDWEGYPLRKDYVAPDTYRGITNKP
jgi:NADH-quinone oxidoreductase subunit C